MMTLAVPRSPRTSATAVYHAPVNAVLYHCHPRGKIQGYFLWPTVSTCIGRKYKGNCRPGWHLFESYVSIVITLLGLEANTHE